MPPYYGATQGLDMKKFVALITIPLIALSNSGSASEPWSKKINRVGCHLHDTTCFVYIDGGAVGPESCKSNSLRWNRETAPNGEEILSLLMMAFAADKSVEFNVSSSTCYGAYPTFSYIRVVR